MYTTTQVAKRANVADNTVRHYVRDYAELFPPAARGEYGPRSFTEDDAQTIMEIAALRKSNVPPRDIVERLQAQQAPPVIDISPETPQTPLQSPARPLQDKSEPFMALQAAFNALQARHDSDAKEIAALRHQVRHHWWMHFVAFYLGVLTMGLLFFLTWWLINGA